MPKPKIPMDDEYDIDMSSTAAVLAKLPGNIAGNLKPLKSLVISSLNTKTSATLISNHGQRGNLSCLWSPSVVLVYLKQSPYVQPKIRKASTRYLLVNTVGRVVKLPANPQYLPKSS